MIGPGAYEPSPLSCFHPHTPQNRERNLTKMVKVTVNGEVIAESNDTIVVENNHYFPPNSVKQSLFTNSRTRYDPLSLPSLILSRFLTFRVHSTVCPWKGSALSNLSIICDLTATFFQNCRVLRRQCKRETHLGHRLVLPRTKRQGTEHQGLRCVLQGNVIPFSSTGDR